MFQTVIAFGENREILCVKKFRSSDHVNYIRRAMQEAVGFNTRCRVYARAEDFEFREELRETLKHRSFENLFVLEDTMRTEGRLIYQN